MDRVAQASGQPVERTAVLVVGGGLAGLSAAMFLAARGVPTVVVERHAGSSPHPRATGFHPRTMELFRTLGLSIELPDVPKGRPLRKVRVASLAGAWYEEQSWTPPADGVAQVPAEALSPAVTTGIAQDRLEPVLRRQAVKLGADVRMSNTLLSFEAGAGCVTAVMRAADGQHYVVEADYLIAADGFRSPVREALGISRSGIGHFRTIRSVLFRAPLEEYLESGFIQFTIDQPDFTAFLTTYLDGRWLLMFADDEERDEATLRDFITRSTGRDDLDIDIVTTGRWEVTALIAERFSAGRIFLAGDAAHVLPPNRGGYGANTGIEDAHNLAWKIAAVHVGQSTPALLDSYDAERRPIAWLRHDQIFVRDDSLVRPAADRPRVAVIEDAAMELGQLYRSGAVLGAGEDLPPARRPDQWEGQPGTRAPHVWVRAGGERLSTIDLLSRQWTLLADSGEWAAAASSVSEQLGIPVGCLQIGVDIAAGGGDELRAAFGLGLGGASLVRPDGYIAWRARGEPGDHAAALSAALAQVASAARVLPPATPAGAAR